MPATPLAGPPPCSKPSPRCARLRRWPTRWAPSSSSSSSSPAGGWHRRLYCHSTATGLPPDCHRTATGLPPDCHTCCCTRPMHPTKITTDAMLIFFSAHRPYSPLPPTSCLQVHRHQGRHPRLVDRCLLGQPLVGANAVLVPLFGLVLCLAAFLQPVCSSRPQQGIMPLPLAYFLSKPDTVTLPSPNPPIPHPTLQGLHHTGPGCERVHRGLVGQGLRRWGVPGQAGALRSLCVRCMRCAVSCRPAVPRVRLVTPIG